MAHHSTQQAQSALSRMGQHILPSAGWRDLALPHDLVAALQNFCKRVQQSRAALQLKSRSAKGMCALFSGPRGSGKTLAAEVVAHALGLGLHRIDLSTAMSQYIDETEKNLRKLFDAAEHLNVILYFDEADTLFGKRTEVKDAHDRYANMEVSHLLQLMDEYKGLVILTRNNPDTGDDAQIGRLCTVFDFPLPKPLERKKT